MTAFSDDTNIRAFRLVAAALNAPVAQPAWTEALLARLTPPLPLVDWHPLDAWSQPEAETVTAAATAPQRTKAQIPPLSGAVDEGDRLRPAPSLRPPVKSSNGDRLTEQAFNPVRDRSPISPIAAATSAPAPTVPSRPPTGTVAPNLPAVRARSSAPHPPIHPSTHPLIHPLSAAPLAALGEIGRLTHEILSSTPAADERPGVRSHPTLPSQPSTVPKPAAIASPTPTPALPAPQSAATPTSSPSPFTFPAPQPPSPPTRSLDLAGLAALYADASSSPPLPPSSPPPSSSPTPPSSPFPFPPHPPYHSAQVEPTHPSTHPPIHPFPPELPNPTENEVAETLTDMVSAILQAQAQRHGVDLS